MARKVVLVSDVTGKEAEESEFTKLVVRQHPSIEEPKQLDIIKGELDALKGADNLVSIEIGENGEKQEIVVTLAEFRKLVKDEVVQGAAGTRGRRKGFSPSAKG